MRKKLESHDGERLEFCGTFERFGTKPGWHTPEKTILLSNVKDKYGNAVTDHIWMNYTKGLQKLGELQRDDCICFHARVKEYVKGYVSYRECIDERTIDYKLSHPTKFMKKKCDDAIKQGFNLEGKQNGNKRSIGKANNFGCRYRNEGNCHKSTH